jgi:hypothetical protein
LQKRTPRDRARGRSDGQVFQQCTATRGKQGEELAQVCDRADHLVRGRNVIDRETGALELAGGRIDRELTRTAFLASPLARDCSTNDMQTGWLQVDIATTTIGARTFGVVLWFDRERLDHYSLCLVDPRNGNSWEGWSESKQLTLRDAHDAWLVEVLGPAEREARTTAELTYRFAWGEVRSTYDARSGSSSIGVRFRR